MVSTPTYKGAEVSKYIRRLLELHKVEFDIKALFYGDQDQIPASPTVCVEPAQTEREWSGAPYQTDNEIDIAILVYMTGLEDNTTIQEKCDKLTDDIADFINKEALSEMFDGNQLNGMLTSGHCRRHEYGYRMLGDKKMRANRLIFRGYSKTKLVEDM